ncbi:LutC/YkgG family protein [Hyphomicrobium sp.]|uniref:LutC/YkgG family protein n=1 Tax=Hyphomicrobium sp. TaxID=82 RepID=UPI002E2F8CFC|nr:LUD domain-containing protein [Hyphomicrobium sp.]HEX2841661.1 LUD domain-containing protein [Hyphomicrobium sp.]
MSTERIIERVRAALGVSNRTDNVRQRAVAERFSHPPSYPRPAFARLDGNARNTRMISCLEAHGTQVIDIDNVGAVPQSVEACLRQYTPRPHLTMADDPQLSSLAWPVSLKPELWHGEPLGDGHAALTHAYAGVAETGTLVLSSGPESPPLLAFLPELHIVALSRDTIVSSFEDAFTLLSAHTAPGRFPRAINLVSGASRTGDIGGRIVKGAHGPRRLAVIIYGPPT